MDKIKEAYAIAVKDLRSCYSDHGIIAGLHQFNDYWARDAFFASNGALELKDFYIVKKQLLHFLKRAGKNKSLLPKKILHRHGIKLGSLLRKSSFGHLFTYKSKDQNSLFVICASNYILKTSDLNFAKINYEKIKCIMREDFRTDVNRNLLLEQGFYEDWADSIRKKGEILYTNVCHYAGLIAVAEIAGILNKKNDQKEYELLASKVKHNLNTMFWNGEYYSDSVGKGGDIFSSGGNMLAIFWGVADKSQTKSILKFIKKNKLESFTLETNYPNYKWWQISPVVRIAGIPDYHNGLMWLWLGCLDVIAKSKVGEKKEAKELLTKIADKIIEYKHVYEVYEKDGKPVKRFFYKSEVPFAWSAGLFVYAVKFYDKHIAIKEDTK